MPQLTEELKALQLIVKKKHITERYMYKEIVMETPDRGIILAEYPKLKPRWERGEVAVEYEWYWGEVG